MIKKLLLLFPLFLVSTASSQEYFDFPRSKVSLIVPEGFEYVEMSRGFVKNEVQNIILVDYPGQSFYTSKKSLNEKTFSQKGIKLLERIDTTIGNYDAVLTLSTSAFPDLTSTILAFGDSTFTFQIIGLFDMRDEQKRWKIMGDLLKTKYDDNKEIDPFAGINFTYDKKSPTVKFSGYESSIWKFTPDGKEWTGTEPLVMISAAGFDQNVSSLKSKAMMNLESLRNMGLFGILKESEKEGDNFYRQIGSCYDADKKNNLFYKLMTNGKMTLQIVAIAPIDNSRLFNDLVMFCNSVEFVD